MRVSYGRPVLSLFPRLQRFSNVRRFIVPHISGNSGILPYLIEKLPQPVSHIHRAAFLNRPQRVKKVLRFHFGKRAVSQCREKLILQPGKNLFPIPFSLSGGAFFKPFPRHGFKSPCLFRRLLFLALLHAPFFRHGVNSGMDEPAILRNLFCSLFQGNIGEGTKSRRLSLSIESVVISPELAACRHDQQIKASSRGELVGLVSRPGIFRRLVRENLVRHTFHPLCRYPARRYFFRSVGYRTIYRLRCRYVHRFYETTRD